MKQITLHNYEAFLLDFSEGRLTSEEMEMLFDFIAAHPEIECDLEELDATPVLLTSHVPNKQKNNLYKDKGAEELAHLIIASTEGVATKSEQNYLKNLTEKDSSLPHEIIIYEAIRLRSSKQAVFSRKELLLQDAPMRYMPWILRVSSIAALFLGIWFSLPLFNQPDAHYVTATLESDNFIEWIDTEEPFTTPLKTNASSDTTVDEITPLPINSLAFLDDNVETIIEELPINIAQHQPNSIRIDTELKDELKKLNIQPTDIQYDEYNNPYFILGMNPNSTNDVNFQPLIQKVTILIDEKVEVKKDENAFYIRVGRFTVSFVKSIFNKNEENNTK